MDGVFRTEGSRLIRECSNEQLWIEPWGADSLRIRGTQLSCMGGEDWALLPQEPKKTVIVIEGGRASITNGKLRAEVSAGGKITFCNQKNEILLQEYVRNRNDPKEFVSSLCIEAREYSPIAGTNDYRLTVRFESREEEKIFGMGQYQQPYLDLKNCSLELAHRNSQASVPFMLSNLGYGFLWNNPAIGRATFGKNMTEWTSCSSKQLDYWVTAGDTPAEIEEAYASAVGTAPMMPDYGTGFWQCKMRYRTQEELLSVAREYKRRNLPISVIVVDFFHWTMQGDWKFDGEYWPDPEGMVRELKGMGIELMVSIWPTVDKRSENFREMSQKGYLVRADRGNAIVMDWMGNTLFYDATNPGARDYLWRIVKKNYYDQGIRIFWLDEAEPEYSHYHSDNYRYYTGTASQVGNIYPVMYAKTFYDGMEEAGQKNILNLIRCAWAGSQRYGALVWSGDINSSFASMRDQLRAGLNMGIAGIPWWTTDIGGFHSGNINDPSFHECLIRWFQYAVFCPVMRLHGDREPHSPPLGTTGGGSFGSGAPNEVWSYGEEVYEILKYYLLLREKLRPYVAGLMKAAHEKGTPPMRPLFYDFPGDDEAWRVDDQFMFGPDILVAPILHEGARSRSVYLPGGQVWRDAYTAKETCGGQWIECEAPLDRIPFFLSGNSDLAPVG